MWALSPLGSLVVSVPTKVFEAELGARFVLLRAISVGGWGVTGATDISA